MTGAPHAYTPPLAAAPLAAALLAAAVLTGCASTPRAADSPDPARIAQAFGEDTELIVVATMGFPIQAQPDRGLEVQLNPSDTVFDVGRAVMQARGELEGYPVAFVRVDFTQGIEPAPDQLLTDLGLLNVLSVADRQPGDVFLVDADTGRIMQRLSGQGLRAAGSGPNPRAGFLKREIERALLIARAG